MSRRRERPRPIKRIRIRLTLEADNRSIKTASEKLPGSRVSHGVLTTNLSETSDPRQAWNDVKMAGDQMRAVFGQPRKEFK